MGIYVKEENQPWNHKQIAGNATGDNALDATSDNNIKNKVVAAKLGNTDISDIGDGTVTGAISQVNSDLDKYYEQQIYIFGDDAERTKTFVLPQSQHDIVAQLQYSVNIIVSMTVPTKLTIDPAQYVLMSGSNACGTVTYNATNRTITLTALTPLDSHDWLIKVLTR